ncbi:MAG: EamA family transporter [Cypionkella sp.]
MTPQPSNVIGALLSLAAFGVYATHDVFVKFLGATYSPFQLIFFSGLLGFPLVTLMLMRDRTDGNLIPKHPFWTVVRTMTSVLTALAAYYAFSVLPLAQSYAIIFAMPIAITLMAIPLLGEKVGLHRGVAIVAGLLGVVVVLRPGDADLNLGHASALAAITNPTVNSYKRINAPRTTSGATWAPNTVTWTGNNRTHMVRVPGPGRFELRLPDGAANPYLMQAVILAAGLDGMRTKADPGKRWDIDMYAEGWKVKGAPKLPLNLLDALREYDKDRTLKAMMGEEFSAAYLKLKHKEWNDYCSHFSAWETQTTLDI